MKNEIYDLKTDHALEVSQLDSRITKLESENKKRRYDNNRMKSKLAKDSSTSSKPPNTNGFKKVFNSREKSGKLQDGQKVHKGHRLLLPENLTELVSSRLSEHEVEDLTNTNAPYISRYVLDTKMQVIVRE